MAMTYATYRTATQELMGVPLNSSDANYEAILPRMIEYAEQRIYREGDFLATVQTYSTDSTTPGTRTYTFPTSPYFITIKEINLITPAATAPDSGTRNALRPVSLDVLNMEWPSATGSALPTKWAQITNQQIAFGPWPDAAYRIELVGTIRPAPLSATNTSTYLTTYLPDLFLACSMIFAFGYQRDFGAQSDDPKAAQSWENQYQMLKQSSDFEEFRRKFAGPGWTPASPTPLAQAPR